MKRQQFSPQKRQECVEYALAHPERSAREIAQDLGIGESTLQHWIAKAKQAGTVGADARQLSPEQKRIQELEREVAHLREVNEIIKKAHVYFVNHPSR